MLWLIYLYDGAGKALIIFGNEVPKPKLPDLRMKSFISELLMRTAAKDPGADCDCQKKKEKEKDTWFWGVAISCKSFED